MWRRRRRVCGLRRATAVDRYGGRETGRRDAQRGVTEGRRDGRDSEMGEGGGAAGCAARRDGEGGGREAEIGAQPWGSQSKGQAQPQRGERAKA